MTARFKSCGFLLTILKSLIILLCCNSGTYSTGVCTNWNKKNTITSNMMSFSFYNKSSNTTQSCLLNCTMNHGMKKPSYKVMECFNNLKENICSVEFGNLDCKNGACLVNCSLFSKGNVVPDMFMSSESCKDLGPQCAISDDECDQIILINGSFTGQIVLPFANCTGFPLFNYSICIFSFNVDEQNQTVYAGEACQQDDYWKYNQCNYSELGVWLYKNDSEFKIGITRNDQRPKTPICFVNKLYFLNLTDDQLVNCTGTNGCKNITCVDPTTVCNNAEYVFCESLDKSNFDSININGKCEKCGDPYKKTEQSITDKQPVTLNSNAFKNISYVVTSLVARTLEHMGNASSADVTSGDLRGIFVKEKVNELDSVHFMYSSKTNFNIIEDFTQMATFPVSVSIPKEAFLKAQNQTNGTPFAAVLHFPFFQTDERNSTYWRNDVFSIEMGANIANLQDFINLTFTNVTEPAVCHSWNGKGSQPNWTTYGCNSTQTGSTLNCKCTHLTFFALLMTDSNINISSSDVTNLTYITSIGCGLSVFFLGVALFMHFLLRRGHASDSVHILINLFLALFLLNLTFLTNESVANTNNEIGCKIMGGLMHYAMLSSFQWFFIEALHLCLQLSQNVDEIKNYVTKIRITGWVPPVIVVTGIFAAQKYNKIVIFNDATKNVSMCWITDSTVHYIVNIGFYAIIFLFTLLTFVVIMHWLCLLKKKQPKMKTIAEKKSKFSDAVAIMGLCCMLGLGWGFAFFAHGPLLIPSLYIFTILNSFQGFFLFIYYYNTSKLFGELETSSEKSSGTTMVLENPYVADTGQEKTDPKKQKAK